MAQAWQLCCYDIARTYRQSSTLGTRTCMDPHERTYPAYGIEFGGVATWISSLNRCAVNVWRCLDSFASEWVYILLPHAVPSESNASARASNASARGATAQGVAPGLLH
eukprot:6209263-Pleurochrysis_carterae.AAC.4